MPMIKANLDDQQIIWLVETHKKRAMHESDPCADHALDMQSFAADHITLWAFWDQGIALAIGALQQIDTHKGEVKTMFVHPDHQGRGLGKQMLQHLMNEAKRLGMQQVFLETGRWEYFTAARKLYARFGFTECPAFGDYQEHPDSIFMHCTLERT